MSREGLCVDIDNVVAATDEVMRCVIREYTQGGVDLGYEDVVEFDYWKCGDKKGRSITREEWPGVHELFSEPENILGIAPMPGAREGVQRLADRYEIHLASSRLPKAHDATRKWLAGYAIPYDTLSFVEHGQKHAVLCEAAAAVEDDYEQAVAFAEQAVPAYLLEHPWNREKPRVANLQWVTNWAELTACLLP